MQFACSTQLVESYDHLYASAWLHSVHFHLSSLTSTFPSPMQSLWNHLRHEVHSIIGRFLSFASLHVQKSLSISDLRTLCPNGILLRFVHGNLSIFSSMRHCIRWGLICAWSQWHRTGSQPSTSSVAQAIANNPQSEPFVWVWMFIMSNVYKSQAGFTKEHISFFKDLLTDIIRLLSYMPTELKKPLRSLGLTLETRIQWQLLTCRIWMNVDFAGSAINPFLAHWVCCHPTILPLLCLRRRNCAARTMLSLSHLSDDSRITLSLMYSSSFSIQIFWSGFAGLSKTCTVAVTPFDWTSAVGGGECTASGSPLEGGSTAVEGGDSVVPLSGRDSWEQKRLFEEGESFPVLEEEEGAFPLVDADLLEEKADTVPLLEPERGTLPLLVV